MKETCLERHVRASFQLAKKGPLDNGKKYKDHMVKSCITI
jgi:hypothetical protein